MVVMGLAFQEHTAQLRFLHTTMPRVYGEMIEEKKGRSNEWLFTERGYLDV